MNRVSIYGLALGIHLLALSACSDVSNRFENNQSVSPSIKTTIPTDLKAFINSGLSVSIDLNGKEFSASGAEFPSGDWEVPIEIDANQSYKIKVSWYFGNHLVMEEYSSIFADPASPRILFTPTYYITAGYARLDDDCDGVSNYDEILNNSEPGPVNESPDANCTNVTNIADENGNGNPSEDEQLYATNHWVFDDIEENNGLLSRFEQSINVTQANDEVNALFETKLIGEEKVENLPIHQIQILFTNNPIHQKAIVFSHREGISSQAAEQNDGTCRTAEPNRTLCQIPFAWQENHWYTATIAESSPGFWQAWINDQTNDEKILIGSIESETNIVWSHAITGMYYAGSRNPQDCEQALPLLAYQFSDIALNDFSVLEANRSFQGTCLQYGGGWSDGKRIVDEQASYSLTIGQD